MIQKAFGDDAKNTAQIKVWHKCFKDGQESAENAPCSGRPATIGALVNIERVQAAVNKDRQLTVRTKADLGISKNTLCV